MGVSVAIALPASVEQPATVGDTVAAGALVPGACHAAVAISTLQCLPATSLQRPTRRALGLARLWNTDAAIAVADMLKWAGSTVHWIAAAVV